MTGFPSRTMAWSSWGETHEEVWYQPGLFEGGGVSWMLSPPTVEYPPFEEVAFRVRQTEGCLDLREKPGGAATLDCLPHGARVALSVPPITQLPHSLVSCGYYSCLPATRHRDGLDWVYVRSKDGREGWLPYGPGVLSGDHLVSPYLDHD